MSSLQTLVLANPNAARGTLGRRWPRIRELIASHIGEFEHAFSDRPGAVTQLARDALRRGGHEMIVAMGGDGTISEVVDGFFDGDGPIDANVALGVLHFGTGGDFCRTISAPKDLPAAAAALAGRATRMIDVGRLELTTTAGARRTRHFVNIASFGISGLVDQIVNASSKAFGGRISFAVATLKAMRRFRPQRARISLDGGEAREVLLQTVAVANGQYFGGGMRIAPEAALDDGVFDVITLGPTSFAELLRHGRRIYSGSHLELPHVHAARARRVVAEPVDPGQPILLDVDGETPGVLPATFDLLPAALRLKVPRPRDAR